MKIKELKYIKHMGAQYIFIIIIQELCISEKIQQLSFPIIPLQESILGAHYIIKQLFLYSQALNDLTFTFYTEAKSASLPPLYFGPIFALQRSSE